MIDIHNHIIFDVDDGCITKDTSIKVILEEMEAGVTDFFLTPHVDFNENISNLDKIEQHYNILCNEIKEMGHNINLHLGYELGPGFNIAEYIQKGKDLTLGNNSRYVLIGPFFSQLSRNVDVILFDLQMMGKTPIIAHPERMYYYIEAPSILESYLNKGFLFQLNGPSLLGKYGKEIKEFAHKLIDLNWVSFVASDNHRNHGYSIMGKVKDYIVENWGEAKAIELLETNPKKIISNESIFVDYKEWKEDKKSFFSFLKSKK